MNGKINRLMKHAYVLMRVYNPVFGEMDAIDNVLNKGHLDNPNQPGPLEQVFLDRFNKAIWSVHVNDAALVICDDTPQKDIAKWNIHYSRIMSILCKHGFILNENLYLATTKGGEGSAMASWRLKRKFLDITQSESDAFAVLLDQDDELYENAIANIGEIMMNKIEMNPVVISPYRIDGDVRLNIASNTDNKRKKWYFACKYYFKHELPGISTIGWTKAYSKGAMVTMVEDFEHSFNSNKLSIDTYLTEHKAYEDFLDFYILINNNVSVYYNRNKSHKYYKHPSSITSNPNLDAFIIDRPAMLATLSRICQDNCSKLCTYWDKYLIQFLTNKIDEIEGILAKYRNEALNGKAGMNSFKEMASGSFSEILKINYQDKYLSIAVDDWRKKHLKEIKKYHQHVPEAQYYLYDWQPSPQEKRLNSIKKINICLRCLSLVIIITVIILFINYWWCYGTDFIHILGIIIPAFITLLTIVQGIQSRAEEKADEANRLRIIYYSEFEDLLRHIKANIKVGIQIYVELRKNKDKSSYRPSYIHFENFKWPENSTLFNEEIVLIIDKSKVDDFNRLRLNVRNMNNSAQWLKEYCQSEKKYNTLDMITMLDWELTRIIAYLYNFMYMRDHNFTFYTGQELRPYIASPEVKAELRSLFSEGKQENKDPLIAHFLEKYFRDRNEQRAVLFNNN